MRLRPKLFFGYWLAFGLASARIASAVPPSPAAQRETVAYVPAVATLLRPASSELRELVERFVADEKDLKRFYSVTESALQLRRLREFYRGWQQQLTAINFESLGVEGRVDATLLRTQVAYELDLLERAEKKNAESAALVPFAEEVAAVQEQRRLMQPVDAAAAANVIERMRQQILAVQAQVSAGLEQATPSPEATALPAKPVKALQPSKVAAARALRRIVDLQKVVEEWAKFYDGYDPLFTWWTATPRKQWDEALADYTKLLREKVLGREVGKDEPIVGDPIGREGLLADLRHEMVAYSPEELLKIAEKEFGWCENEMRRASREMGLGDDWKAALDKVKADHGPPGGQPALVRELALEAIQFVEQRDLVTVPPLAADFWLIRMMSIEQQKEAPFFLGGADILVAFPNEAMDEEQKLQSMRANNRHFARATVFHELVPGHHLQSYYAQRVNQHRQLFTTPFWVEGWAVWWEFYFWDLKFPQTPEDRIGMLFWRMHRCARIMFSLNFHLGNWTPQQCIDFLVDRVGHERWSATGEVRRSFGGDWSPLYQAGYLLGAMQLRELHTELAANGKMTDRNFHDAIVTGGPMPIEMERARLRQEKVPADFKSSWRWAGNP